MVSQEPRARRSLPLEEGSGPSLGQGLGQQWGTACLRSSDQTGKPRAPTHKSRHTVGHKSSPTPGKGKET